MADIEHQISIARPISDVFNAATQYEDETALRQWQTSIVSLGVTAGKPLRTGSMIGMTKRFMSGKVFVNFDVIDLQRNKRFEVKGVHGRFAFRREIEFSPSGRDTTIRDQITLQIPWLYILFRPFVRAALIKQTGQEWLALKKLLET